MQTTSLSSRLSIVAGLTVASFVSVSGAAIDFRQALDLASSAVQSGTAIEIERTQEAGVEAIEVEFAISGGAWIREVYLAASDGTLLRIDTYAASTIEAAEIAALLPQIAAASIDLPEAANRATAAFPNTEVLRVDYTLDSGVLFVEALLRQNGATFEVDVNANSGNVVGGPNSGGGDVPPTPGDGVMSLAIATASAARPALTPVEIARETEDGVSVWSVRMLNPDTVRVTEILVSADGAGVVDIDNDTLDADDLREMQNLAALFPLGLTLDDAIVATRNRFANSEILAVEFEARGGTLRIESLIRENGVVRWVEFNPNAQGGGDGGGGGEPGPDLGFAAIADTAIAERPDLTLIEVERDNSRYYEATLVSSDLTEVVEIEINRDGTIRETDPITLGSDAAEVSRILSLIGPDTIPFPVAANVFAAAYPTSDIREIEFDVRRGQLIYEATVRINGSLVDVFIPANDASAPPQIILNNCPADLNSDGVLDFFDIVGFLTAFRGQNPAADWNADTSFNFLDLAAYLAEFNTGCP